MHEETEWEWLNYRIYDKDDPAFQIFAADPDAAQAFGFSDADNGCPAEFYGHSWDKVQWPESKLIIARASLSQAMHLLPRLNELLSPFVNPLTVGELHRYSMWLHTRFDDDTPEKRTALLLLDKMTLKFDTLGDEGRRWKTWAFAGRVLEKYYVPPMLTEEDMKWQITPIVEVQ